MTIDELRKLLDDPRGPFSGLDGDTPVLLEWNCAGYAPAAFRVEDGWRREGRWVRFAFPDRASTATAVLVIGRDANKEG